MLLSWLQKLTQQQPCPIGVWHMRLGLAPTGVLKASFLAENHLNQLGCNLSSAANHDDIHTDW